jgi:hypothetical protein
MRIFVLAFSPVVTLGLVACGGSTPTHGAQTTTTPPAARTDSQGTSPRGRLVAGHQRRAVCASRTPHWRRWGCSFNIFVQS